MNKNICFLFLFQNVLCGNEECETLCFCVEESWSVKGSGLVGRRELFTDKRTAVGWPNNLTIWQKRSFLQTFRTFTQKSCLMNSFMSNFRAYDIFYHLKCTYWGAVNWSVLQTIGSQKTHLGCLTYGMLSLKLANHLKRKCTPRRNVFLNLFEPLYYLHLRNKIEGPLPPSSPLSRLENRSPSQLNKKLPTLTK